MMRGTTRRFVLAMGLLWCAGLLAGCWQVERVSAGREFPYSRARVIKQHLFTTRDVRELLGEPLQVEKLAERITRWRYFCRRESARRILLFFDTDVHVTDQEVLVTFDGTLVHDVKSHIETYQR